MSQAISFRRSDHNSNANRDVAVSPRWRASPMSFKMGSFVGSLGSKLYHAPGCSPIPALESTDFRMNGTPFTPSSFDYSKFKTTGSSEETSNYTCCGLPLHDLHALLDHFEESHVLVLDHSSLANQPPAVAAAAAAAATGAPVVQNPQVAAQAAAGAYDDISLGSMDMEDIELEDSDTPGSSASSSQSSSPNMGAQAALAQGTAANTSALGAKSYFPDYRNLVGADSSDSPQQCIPPSLLFSSSATPSSSRPSSSSGDAKTSTTSSNSKASSSDPISPTLAEGAIVTTNPDGTMVVSGPGILHPGPPPPNAAPTSLAKPFKCPTPNCNKSYKQANGLKYHLTHGQCCFIPKDPSLDGLDELEKDKIERPFGCGIGGCERRYKNMNGLRYHYQHSGAHGAVGLALLAAGTHSVQVAAANATLGRSQSAKSGNGSYGSYIHRPSTPGAQESVSTPSSTTTSPVPGAATPAVVPGGGSTSSLPSTPTLGYSQASSQPAVFSYAPGTYGFPAAYAQGKPGFNAGQMTNAIAFMAGGFASSNPGNPATVPQSTTSSASGLISPTQPQMATFQSQSQRPHQLLRTHSTGAGAVSAVPAPATTTTTAATALGPVGDIDMDMEMA